MRTLFWHTVGLVAALSLAGPLAASAQGEGYDLLQTPSGAAQIDLSSIPGFSPATIALKGVPICPTCIGGADTIMHRRVVRSPQPNLEVVALFLKNNVGVKYNGQPVDVYVTVNHSDGVIGTNVLPQPDVLPPSTGKVTVHGQTFDSEIHVVADVIIVRVGGKVTDPGQQLHHQQGPPVDLKSSGSAWISTPPTNYPTTCLFPANGFYPAGPVAETAPTAHSHPVAPAGSTDVKIVPAIAPVCASQPELADEFELPGGNFLKNTVLLRYRTCPGKSGTRAPGLTVYEYSVDLTKAVIPNNPCITSLSFESGSVDHAYVVIQGTAGAAPYTAVRSGKIVTFFFQPRVCVGQRSPWFGLASDRAPKTVTATATTTVGSSLTVELPAPQP